MNLSHQKTETAKSPEDDFERVPCAFRHFVGTGKLFLRGESADVVLWADARDRGSWRLLRLEGPPKVIAGAWQRGRVRLEIANVSVRPLVSGHTREPGVLYIDARLVRAEIEQLERERWEAA